MHYPVQATLARREKMEPLKCAVHGANAFMLNGISPSLGML